MKCRTLHVMRVMSVHLRFVNNCYNITYIKHNRGGAFGALTGTESKSWLTSLFAVSRAHALFLAEDLGSLLVCADGIDLPVWFAQAETLPINPVNYALPRATLGPDNQRGAALCVV